MSWTQRLCWRSSEPVTWRPWQKVDEDQVRTLTFSRDACGLGIGSASVAFEEARDHFGEFLAVAGNVVYQPPDEQAPPDYLIAEKQFLPRMQCIQTLSWTGAMKHLVRFAPTDAMPFYPISDLLTLILEQTGSTAAGFVMLGEVEGMVGTALIQSPGRIKEDREIVFPELRQWLTFCGERSFARQQALLVGVVSAGGGPLLPQDTVGAGQSRPHSCSRLPLSALAQRKDRAGHGHGEVLQRPVPAGGHASDR